MIVLNAVQGTTKLKQFEEFWEKVSDMNFTIAVILTNIKSLIDGSEKVLKQKLRRKINEEDKFMANDKAHLLQEVNKTITKLIGEIKENLANFKVFLFDPDVKDYLWNEQICSLEERRIPEASSLEQMIDQKAYPVSEGHNLVRHFISRDRSQHHNKFF